MNAGKSAPPSPRYDCGRCFDLGCRHCFAQAWGIASWWRTHPEEGATGYQRLVADEPSAWGKCSTGAPS